MKNIILTLVMIFSFVSLVEAQVLNQTDINYFKKLREIRSIEKQIEVKEETQRIAVSAVKTSHQSGINSLNIQLATAEAELEALP